MLKLERIYQPIFGSEGNNDEFAVFGTMKTGTPVYSKSLQTLFQSPSFLQGWQDAVVADKAPFLEETNALFLAISQQLAYLFQKGIPEWDPDTTYYTNTSFCQFNGVLYQSLTDDNINNNPALNNSSWKLVFDFNNYLNHTQITNCILEAPNGVVELDNNTITLKSGVKLLMPDGRREDGTLKNIEKTVTEDISHTLSIDEQSYHMFYFDEEGYPAGWGSDYIISEIEPSLSKLDSFTLWYNPKTNYFKRSDNGMPYKTIHCCYLGGLNKKTASSIESIKPIQPLDVIKRSDSIEVSGWGFPSGESVELTLGASGRIFKAPKNGWLVFAKNVTAPSQYVQLNSTGSDLGYRTNIITGDNSPSANHIAYCYMPMLEGQHTRVLYDALGEVIAFRFIYSKGVN